MTLIWTAVDHKQVHFRSWLVGGFIPFLVLCLSICQFTFGKKLVSVACCNALCHLCVRARVCVPVCGDALYTASLSYTHTHSWGGTVTFSCIHKRCTQCPCSTVLLLFFLHGFDGGRKRNKIRQRESSKSGKFWTITSTITTFRVFVLTVAIRFRRGGGGLKHTQEC